MRNSQYVKNSVSNLQKYAKSCGYKVKYHDDDVNFYFDVYKCKWFGLNNEVIRKFHGSWDAIEYNFYTVQKMVHEFIKYKYLNYD